MSAKKNIGKPKITVTYRKIADGVYKPDYTCPPHIWYYADLIMHWKCWVCPAIRHTEPKTGLRADNITREYCDENETHKAR